MEQFEDLFRHYPEYRVIICKRCQYAPIPTHIQTHLKIFHSRIPADERKSIVQYVQSLPTPTRIESRNCDAFQLFPTKF